MSISADNPDPGVAATPPPEASAPVPEPVVDGTSPISAAPSLPGPELAAGAEINAGPAAAASSDGAAPAETPDANASSPRPMAGRARPSPQPEPDEKSVFDLIRGIKAGQIAGKSLAAPDRQRCIAHLVAEGLSVPEIAEAMSIGERTIQRDKAEIRKSLALRMGDSFAPEMMGWFIQQAEQTLTALARAGRERDATITVRVEIARTRWTVVVQLMERLQSLGMLPTAAQQIHADLTHRVDDEPDLATLERELMEVEAIVQAVDPGDAQARDGLTSLRGRLEQMRLTRDVRALRAGVTPAAGPDQLATPTFPANPTTPTPTTALNAQEVIDASATPR